MLKLQNWGARNESDTQRETTEGAAKSDFECDNNMKSLKGSKFMMFKEMTRQTASISSALALQRERDERKQRRKKRGRGGRDENRKGGR